MVWDRIGAGVDNYIEPFFGSGAVLFGRPGWSLGDPPTAETINDRDGFVSNAWRAIAADPDEVAQWCDWPVNEDDLHARHIWLVERRESLTARLCGDPDYFDAKIAGWWLWGINCWIGSSWCSGEGPWQAAEDEDGHRQLVHVGNLGMGVHRQLVHVGNLGMGVHRQRVHIGDLGMGVHRQLVHVGDLGRGNGGDGSAGLCEWMRTLSERLRRVRVCCGDWQRCCDSAATLFPIRSGTCGVLLDPPYTQDERDNGRRRLYDHEVDIADEVFSWCVKWGDTPRLRIALCGYEGEIHDRLVTEHGWSVSAWSSDGGYGSQASGEESAGLVNRHRERIWWSPGCLNDRQASLFGEATA